MFLNPVDVDIDAAEALIDADTDEVDYSIPEEDELPFACFICREDFKQPVVTVCGHYYCGPCAMEDNKKNPKCRVCGKKTFGVFNKAVKLIKKLAAVEKAKLEEQASSSSGGGNDNSSRRGIAGVKLKPSQGTWEEVVAEDS